MNSHLYAARVFCAASLVVSFAAAARGELINYWPLDDGAGEAAVNEGTGSDATLMNGVAWVEDPQRGMTVEFDGASHYIDGGLIGPIGPDENFTWAFWSNPNAAQPVNNDVIIGNRQPDAGWSKFTPAAFEFRDITPTFNHTIDYVDHPSALTPAGQWTHHAVVKKGDVFVYYRNGLALGTLFGATGYLPEATPFYMGGDAVAGENWQGRLSDVALWTDALPLTTIASLASGTVRPDAAPLTEAPPPAVMATVLEDSFASGLDKWDVTNLGLENTGNVGYNPPSVEGGQLTLSSVEEGITNQYWFGSSVESKQLFDSRVYTDVKVTRVSLTGSGSAYRSSVWILGDASHYLHFSQNVGETGWSYNMRDDGGFAAATSATGSGINIVPLDGLDFSDASHEILLRVRPLSISGRVNVEMWVDGTLYAVQGFSNFPASFRVVLTGQARAAGDGVTAVFDDVLVRQQVVENLPPYFANGFFVLPTVAEGQALTGSAPVAADPENQALTYSKVSGPDWIQISASGALTGTPAASDVGAHSLVVQARDPGGLAAAATLAVRVRSAATPNPVLTAWWPLNDGAGSEARETTGLAVPAAIQNDLDGGLDATTSAWTVDAERGTVLSFNGEDQTGVAPVGAYAQAGTWPVLGLEDDFAFTCWVKSDQGANNDIILGNRYTVENTEFVPRQFIKLTTSQFEWHFADAGQDLNFEDILPGVWMHHTVVKDGDSLFYYRNGALQQLRRITGGPDQELPLFFGGQGVENWRGRLSDVRFFSTALIEPQIASIMADGTPPPPSGFAITSIQVAANKAVTLSWPQEAGKRYTVEASVNLKDWVEQVDNLEAATYTVNPGGAPNTATEPAVYFRVISAPAAP